MVKCFKCGVTGQHQASDCPDGTICFKCGDKGHRGPQCTKAQGRKRREEEANAVAVADSLIDTSFPDLSPNVLSAIPTYAQAISQAPPGHLRQPIAKKQITLSAPPTNNDVRDSDISSEVSQSSESTTPEALIDSHMEQINLTPQHNSTPAKPRTWNDRSDSSSASDGAKSPLKKKSLGQYKTSDDLTSLTDNAIKDLIERQHGTANTSKDPRRKSLISTMSVTLPNNAPKQ
jgi:hypothetical protein